MLKISIDIILFMQDFLAKLKNNLAGKSESLI